MIDLETQYAWEMMRKRRLSKSTGYRADDLVLHLDAIQNTPSGHSSDTTTWYDLAGNMDITMSNVTWGNDHCQFAGNTDSYGRGGHYTFTNGCTIEAVFMRTGGFSANGSEIAGWAINGGTGITRPALSALTTGMHCRLDARSAFIGGVSPALSTMYYTGLTHGLLVQNGDSYAHTEELYPVGETFGDFIMANYLDSAGIDILKANNGIFLNGKIFAVRVYDAVLSESELLAHFALDNERFGIIP